MNYIGHSVKPNWYAFRMTEKRPYVQRNRAATAEETRRRILDAAHELLAGEPAQGVSIDRIARQAGVARSTVYLVFGNRTQLFEALAVDFLERLGFQRVVDAVRLPDARDALLASLREGCRLYAGGRDVGRALFSLSLLDPDAAGAIVVLERRPGADDARPGQAPKGPGLPPARRRGTGRG